MINSGLFKTEFVKDAFFDLSLGIFYGSITGLVIGFIELLPQYLRKVWDLHKIVPYFLGIHLITSSFIIFIGSNIDVRPIELNGFILGYLLWGMIALLAYISEIEKEHLDDH